jgi:hypothetical protein
MATFEEVAQAAQRDHEFEMIHEAFTELVENSDHYRLCQRIFPFLAHVNDGGNLSALHSYLQSSMQSPIILKGMIHNVVNTAKTNPNLKRTLEILIGRVA